MLGGVGGDLLGGAIGQTGNQLGQAFQSIVGTMASAKENKKAREWAEKMMRIGPSLRVQGLRAAGLNPVLAAGQSYAGVPSAGMIGTRGGSGAGGLDITAAQQLRNMRKQGEILQEQLEQEWNRTAASDYMVSQASADVQLTSARAALAAAGVPRARTQERFLGDLEREVMGMYERAGGLHGIRRSVQDPQYKFLNWLTQEYREGRTPLQRLQRWRRRRKKSE